jgi:hypothetical protein
MPDLCSTRMRQYACVSDSYRAMDLRGTISKIRSQLAHSIHNNIWWQIILSQCKRPVEIHRGIIYFLPSSFTPFLSFLCRFVLLGPISFPFFSVETVNLSYNFIFQIAQLRKQSCHQRQYVKISFPWKQRENDIGHTNTCTHAHSQ